MLYFYSVKMSITYAIIDNQCDIKKVSICQKYAKYDMTTYDIMYEYPDETTKKLLFVSDYMPLYGYCGVSQENFSFLTMANGVQESNMYNMISDIVQNIKKYINSKYGNKIIFYNSFEKDKMKIYMLYSRKPATVTTPILLQQSKANGGEKIQVKNLDFKTTTQELIKYMPLLKHRSQTKNLNIQKKDIYPVCKYLLSIRVVVIKKACYIKLIAHRVDIKYNVTKTLSSIDTDMVVLAPSENKSIKELVI